MDLPGLECHDSGFYGSHMLSDLASAGYLWHVTCDFMGDPPFLI